jgi:hypothetical protein
MRRLISPPALKPRYNTLVFTPEVDIVIDSVTVDDARASVTAVGSTFVVHRVYRNDQAVLDVVDTVELSDG